MNQIHDCGHASDYPETKDGRVLCMSCAMAYDYSKAKDSSLFN